MRPLTDLPGEVREAVERATQLVADQDREHLILIDPRSGDTLFVNRGTRRSVKNPADSDEHLYRGAISVHNHPGSDSAFSHGDVAVGIHCDQRAVVVVARETVYVLERPPYGWTPALSVSRNVDAVLDQLDGAPTNEVRCRLLRELAGKLEARFWQLPRSRNVQARWTSGPRGVAVAWPC